jgi:hypothetical protein
MCHSTAPPPGGPTNPRSSWQSWAFRPRPPACVIYVEYDGRHERLHKRFDDVEEAHRFYVLKRKAGKHPKVMRVAL